MSNRFFDQPIINSPYEYPKRHWELDEHGQPTHTLIERRRVVSFLTPIPKPKKRKTSPAQQTMVFDEGLSLSSEELQYDPTPIINELRVQVDRWRELPDRSRWMVTPETERLLLHWRHHQFSGVRPFFCQVEAVETLIWLVEVAPKLGSAGKRFTDYFESASLQANPELLRLALKLATGAGKTTVMAMIIIWQTINALHHPNDKRFSRGFLLVAPGLTIRDRLRVLQPNDPDSYYAQRELLPVEMLPDLQKAKIVITNYHAFKLRERIELSKGGRAMLKGRGPELQTLETEGQMLQRVMPSLMGLKRILVINDEAHHCYRERPDSDDDADLKGEERQEAERNNEAARLWISGLEIVKRHLGINQVIDLSATPFFLRGSGYAEGTLFPWTISDFSLMDAIECGIVKLPRVPIADNTVSNDMPMYRDLWKHIAKDMPKKGRTKGGTLDPQRLPAPLVTALEALYKHYQETFELWQESGIEVPPCFIIVCNNTATSKLIYDYISGYLRPRADGSYLPVPGHFELFRNYDEQGNPTERPNTLLIDSEQLESGDALDDTFRSMAQPEIERFKRELIERTGDASRGDQITDQELLREVMNTVGKPGRLGASIRCVVSVSMLTEGWDTNTVTHVLGVRAFGTQLLCEQVIGRALRRQSYELNEQGLFPVEYADVFGVPFDFTAKPVISKPQKPTKTLHVHAVNPEREHLEITFPRVVGYRIELPNTDITAEFNEDSRLVLDPELVGATQTQNSGIIGETVQLDISHLKEVRKSTLIYKLTMHLMHSDRWRTEHGDPPTHLFASLKAIVREWLNGYLVCTGDTQPAQLLYYMLAEMAVNKINQAIDRAALHASQAASTASAPLHSVKAILDSYNPSGSTRHVSFHTSKSSYWATDARRSHINYVVLDSNWEAECCRVLEKHPQVYAYVKNHNLGFEVPYRIGSELHHYRPDFIALVDDGHGPADRLHVVLEVKGRRGMDAQAKKETMDLYWVPAVNQLGSYGRWAFAELRDVFEMETDFERELSKAVDDVIADLSTQE